MVGGLKEESRMKRVLDGPPENFEGGSDEMILKVAEELMNSATDFFSIANDGTAAEEAMVVKGNIKKADSFKRR